LWAIPTIYTVVSVAAGLVLPRLEQAYLRAYEHDISAAAALAYFSAVASGMMALTGIGFAVAFVVVQFSAVAYSPRLVAMFASDPKVYHSLGILFATFTYSLAALIWTDRGGSGAAPLFSTYLVGALLVVSLVAFSMLVHGVGELQIQNVLRNIGARGRAAIEAVLGAPSSVQDPDDASETPASLGPATQTLTYSGAPCVVAEIDVPALMRLAASVDAVVSVERGVGDPVAADCVLLRVRGGAGPLPEAALARAVRLAEVRILDRDPRYALRLLVDIAIRALSPAVNDPTTAVQALDQIEDLLYRVGRRRLGGPCVRNAAGALRVVVPAPQWSDYLELAFDEIRQFGSASVQVDRRLRAGLVDLAASVEGVRRDAVLDYLAHLDKSVRGSAFDDPDRATASKVDRQGLGLTRPSPPHNDG
jgi:uncharacterized membrane protein